MCGLLTDADIRWSLRVFHRECVSECNKYFETCQFGEIDTLIFMLTCRYNTHHLPSFQLVVLLVMLSRFYTCVKVGCYRPKIMFLCKLLQEQSSPTVQQLTHQVKSVHLTIVLSPFERRPLILEPHLLHIFCPHHFLEVLLHLVCTQSQVAHPG